MLLKSLMVIGAAYAGYKLMHRNEAADSPKESRPLRKSTTFKNFSSQIESKANDHKNPFAPVTPSHP